MSNELGLKVTIDPSSHAWLAEITRCLLVADQLVPRPVEIIELISGLPDRSVAFNLRSLPAHGAGNRRIILEPCQALRDFVAAVRAREGMGEFVAELGHDAPSAEAAEPIPVAALTKIAFGEGDVLVARIDRLMSDEMQKRVRNYLLSQCPHLAGRLIVIDRSVSISVFGPDDIAGVDGGSSRAAAGIAR